MFGVTASTLIVAGVAAGAAVYTADKQRKAIHQQQDAINAAQTQDTKDKANAEATAAVAANTARQDAKRRQRNSALGLGATDDTVDALGGPSAGSVLAGGGPTRVGSAVNSPAYAGSPGSALGAGSATSGGSGGRYVRAPKAMV
jgi:hypothetical protein